MASSFTNSSVVFVALGRRRLSPGNKKIETLGGFEGGPGLTEKYKALIYTSVLEDLEDSINENSRQNSRLTRSIIFLNLLIALATIALALIGGTDLWLNHFEPKDIASQISTELSK